MNTLFRFLKKFYFVFVFIFLEIFAFTLLVKHNYYHQSLFVNSSNRLVGGVYEISSRFYEFFHLRAVNRELIEENVRLRRLLSGEATLSDTLEYQVYDTLNNQNYEYRWARVLRNSVNRQQNFLTLNKGWRDGLEPEMAVLSSMGVVGVVKDVSEHYSTVISLLNTTFQLSAKIQKNNYFGSLVWQGEDFRYAKLLEIPRHVDVEKGDLIISSGYSALFPEGVLVGTIVDYKLEKGANFYDITVKLSTNFRNLSYVQVVGDLTRNERKQLEESND